MQIRGLKYTHKSIRLMGGEGSGFHGHAGRPGSVGGSVSAGSGNLSAPNWTSDELAALHSFTWLGSQTINSELREGNLSTNKPFGMRSRKEDVALLDSAIAKMSLTKKEQTLYSRIDAIHLKRSGELEVGKVVTEPGYISATTIKGGRAPYQGREYLMEAVLELKIPKGSKGILPLQGISHYPQELEHLIHRNSKYRIENIIEPDNSYIDPWVIQASLL